jgi:orotate phosphoribosyltransferase
LGVQAPDSDIVALARAVETCCRVNRSVGYGSTRATRDHFDTYRLASSPTLLRALAELMATLLPPHTEVLGGLELGGLPIAAVLSQVTGLPGVLVRARRRPYGSQRFVEGVDCTGRMVVLVDDAVSSGHQLRNSVAALRQLGATVTTVLCAIDRLDVPRTVGQDVEVRVAVSRAVLERVRLSS